jgi:glycosyltransferase involved in cell wall biosynthesis
MTDPPAGPARSGGRLLLHVVSGLGLGGAEAALARLVEGLGGRGWRSVVVSLRDHGHFGPRLAAAGAEVVALGLQSAAGGLRATGRLVALARRWEPAVVQGWMYHGNLAAVAAARVRGRRPLVWNVRHALHAPGDDKAGTRTVIRAGAALSSLADRVVYNSATAAAQHAALGYADRRAVVIPNGVDAGRFRPRDPAAARAALGLPPAGPVVGWVGRRHPVKGLDLFLAAARQVARGLPELQVVLAGRGTDQPDVAARVADWPAAGGVRCLGEVNDMPALLPAFDVLCLASRSEAFPNVVAEGLACGVPCVATDVGDVRAIVGPGGHVVPPGDPASLAAALAAVLAAPEECRRLGEAGREHVAARFGLPAMLDRYEALFRDLGAG